jgi:hypothetical protein
MTDLPVCPFGGSLRRFVRHFKGLSNKVPDNAKQANAGRVMQNHVELHFGALQNNII